MNWIFFILFGCFLTSLTASFFRGNPFSLGPWEMIGVMLPTIILSQYAFTQAFTSGPSFFSTWFTGTVGCSIFAYLCSIVFFGESVKLLDLGAVAAIILGAYQLIVRT